MSKKIKKLMRAVADAELRAAVAIDDVNTAGEIALQAGLDVILYKSELAAYVALKLSKVVEKTFA
jgi:hypothetical protein